MAKYPIQPKEKKEFLEKNNYFIHKLWLMKYSGIHKALLEINKIVYVCVCAYECLCVCVS